MDGHPARRRVWSRGSGLTVGEYLEGWLATKAALRASSRAAYRRHIDLYLKPGLGHLNLAELCPEDIDVMFEEIQYRNARRGRKVGPTTLRRIYATLHSALNGAVLRGYLDRNPASVVELPPAHRGVRPTWSSDQVVHFLQTTADDPLHLAYRLLLVTGLRRGELAGLCWGDVDLDNGTLTVRTTLINVAGDLVTGPPKSRRGIRTIPLDSRTIAEFRRFKEKQGPHDPLAIGPVRVVFTDPHGHQMDPVYFSRHFATLRRRHGLPMITLHDLRHTSASLGLDSGESLLEVSRRLGHSSIAITADTYAHIPPATARASSDRLARRLDHT